MLLKFSNEYETTLKKVQLIVSGFSWNRGMIFIKRKNLVITHYRNVSLIRVNGLVSKATSTYCIQCQEAWMVHCTNVTISVHIFCKKCS